MRLSGSLLEGHSGPWSAYPGPREPWGKAGGAHAQGLRGCLGRGGLGQYPFPGASLQETCEQRPPGGEHGRGSPSPAGRPPSSPAVYPHVLSARADLMGSPRLPQEEALLLPPFHCEETEARSPTQSPLAGNGGSQNEHPVGLQGGLGFPE